MWPFKRAAPSIKREDRLILRVSKSTFDVYMRLLDRAWSGDPFLLDDLHARGLANTFPR